MSEQKLIRKQLIKNMFYTFIVFALILISFNLVVYKQASNSLYKSIDNELLETLQNYNKYNLRELSIPRMNSGINSIIEIKINPRLISIIRDKEGNIINSESIGRIYDEYIADIEFNKNSINKIYNINLQNTYNYRGITVKLNTDYGEKYYIQLLANVDGEVETLDSLEDTLIVGSSIILIVAIIGSYILSKMTLKPIIDSYKKQTEFVQNASHELRTPLTIIQAKQELLLQEPEGKIIEKSEDINIMLKETRRLTKLIKELMILAMSDTNELKLNKENIEIDELIKEVSIPYVEFAELQNKEIKLDLKYNKKINIDVNKINQLIVILLDNAIKYTSENDKIDVRTYMKDGKCVIEIIDTGVGISKEAEKHIFERFYREDKAGSREKGGTGIGLSIAYTIVKMHGGSIKIFKNEPKGTKVEIKL